MGDGTLMIKYKVGDLIEIIEDHGDADLLMSETGLSPGDVGTIISIDIRDHEDSWYSVLFSQRTIPVQQWEMKRI